MKIDFIFAFAAALTFAVACSEPLNEVVEEATPLNEAVATTIDGRTVADVNMERFAEILSKAVAQNRDLRVFFKEQAMEKIDNDYNVFYPIVKRKIVGGETMEQMLAKYADESELAEIQATVPLLNVHLPELAGSTVADLDPDDEELPVLYNNVMYYDGEPIDTLAADEVPGFNILVVTESTSIRKKTGLSKSTSDLALDDEYEYVDASCKPMAKSLSKMAEYENANEMYYGQGVFPDNLLASELVRAYNVAHGNQYAVRAAMYYNWTSLNDKKTKANPRVIDRIFRIKMNEKFIHSYDKLTSGDDEPELFSRSAIHVAAGLTREKVIIGLVKGRLFRFKFVVTTPEAENGEAYSKEMFLSAPAYELFDFKLNKKRRLTNSRQTKYVYSFDWDGTKVKWCYFDRTGSSIEPWYLDKGMFQKHISVYLCDPKSATSQKITNAITTRKAASYSTSLSAAENVLKILSLGISGALKGSNTKAVSNTESYTIRSNDRFLGNITLDFFNDPVIQTITPSHDVTLPECKIGDELYISILPDYYLCN